MKTAIKNLAIIPARSGSKGIKHKNLQPILGKPLILHTIEFAKQHADIDMVVVSTDDTDIIELAKQHDVTVVQRPDELCSDTSLVIEAIRYTITNLEKRGFDIQNLFLLEATSPLRTDTDLATAVSCLESDEVDSVATFSPSSISPGRLWKLQDEQEKMVPYIEGAVAWLPRQKQPQAYELNGLVYGLKVITLKENSDAITLLQGRMSSIIIEDRKVVDIDEAADLAIVEALLQMRDQKITEKEYV